jgi:hypothetical protein
MGVPTTQAAYKVPLVPLWQYAHEQCAGPANRLAGNKTEREVRPAQLLERSEGDHYFLCYHRYYELIRPIDNT